ncbi:hypothetical protein [Nocardia macrotermitis]|uniref:hypothetical protein n=1 Tax=Nocardia macrotermitis TaxID=2585198 RepID=UPI001294CE14|nr:hypothetical protein [Nocardia macrotermitis]
MSTSNGARSAIARFGADLAELRLAAGSPSHRRILALSKPRTETTVSVNTLRNAERGERLPSVAAVITYVRGCHAAAAAAGMVVDEPRFTVLTWQKRWKQLKASTVTASAGETAQPTGQAVWLPNLTDMTYLLMPTPDRVAFGNIIPTTSSAMVARRSPNQQVALLGGRPVVTGRLDDPNDVALLLIELSHAREETQIEALLKLDLMSRIVVDESWGVTGLLTVLTDLGADEQATALARRAAVGTPVTNLYFVHDVLVVLQKAGAHDQIAVLLLRDPAGNTDLDDGFVVAKLLKQLWDLGFQQQTMKLLRRAATGVDFSEGEGVAHVVRVMLDIGQDEYATELAGRSDFLEHPDDVANLLWSLREVGAEQQVEALLDRNLAATISLEHNVSELVRSFWEAGAVQQAATLANRAVANGKDRIGAYFEKLMKDTPVAAASVDLSDT